DFDRLVEHDLAGICELADTVSNAVEPDVEDVHSMRRAARGVPRKLADRQMVLAGDDDAPSRGRVDLAGEIDDPGAAAERALAGSLDARRQHIAVVDGHVLEQHHARSPPRR